MRGRRCLLGPEVAGVVGELRIPVGGEERGEDGHDQEECEDHESGDEHALLQAHGLGELGTEGDA